MVRQSFYIHAFSRGVDKRIIFMDNQDYIHFFLALTLSLRPKAPSMSLFKEFINNQAISPRDFTPTSLNRKYGKPQVSILTLVLMPNHFHLQLKFFSVSSCSKLLQRTIGSYTKYFNHRHQREGRLFSSTTKKVPIVTDDQNIYLNKYIHTNPINSQSLNISQKKLETYRWSSFNQYLGIPQNFKLKNKFTFSTSYFCNPEPIMKNFSNVKEYKDFILSSENFSNIINP
jgi:REP element-mobilizing transposase RayT